MPAAVSLSQMVDLSLGTPEIGAVNFNVMHSLLHAIIRRLNIADVKADIDEHDRDFLSTSKIRAKSTLSDADSGRGEESEDGFSEKSAPPFRPSPYHRMELKVEKLAQQLEELNQLPSNSDLFARTTKAKGDSSAVADMWQYMQMKKRVDANEEGVGKLFSLIEDMMKEMKELKDANKELEERLKGINLDELKNRLDELEKVTNELNEKFSELPTPEEFALFVTWSDLEAGLKGLRSEIAAPSETELPKVDSITEPPPPLTEAESQLIVVTPPPVSDTVISEIQQPVVTPPPDETVSEVEQPVVSPSPPPTSEAKFPVEKQLSLPKEAELAPSVHKPKSAISQPLLRHKSEQRLPVGEKLRLPSRPSSSRISSRLSTTSTAGPTNQLLDILETLGKLDESHKDLIRRVEILEEEMKNKADKSALEGLGVPPELLEQIAKLKEELDALAGQMDKPPSTEGMLAFLASVITLVSKLRRTRTAVSMEVSTETETSTDTDTVESSTSEELLAAYNESQLGGPEQYKLLSKRIAALEDRLRTFQETLLDDSAYASSDVTDLTSWLGQMENKIAGHITEPSTADEDESTKPDADEQTKKDKEKEKEEEEKQKKKEEAVAERVDAEHEIKQGLEEILEDMSVISSQTLLSAPDLQATNDRVKKLAYNLNEQMHQIRDKVFLLDHELKRMAKGVEFALMRAKVSGINEMDSDALSRAQHAILQLQAEVEKLHDTTTDIIDENGKRVKQIEDLLAFCERLQQQKADKDYVQMEVDVKADKRALENKVNRKLFDETKDEINKMIKEILDKLSSNEEDWKSAYGKLAEDVDGKLDRLELDPLKEWLENRLKALNEKLKKYQNQMDWSEDDAAGIRKQLIQRFHCISCDRPVDMMPTGPVPSLPAQSGLPPTRSPRPYTTFELEQIRQHAKSCLTGKNAQNYERALAMRQLASLKKSDLRAYLIHFKQDFDALARENFANAESTDYYATPRPCGGSHTLTYPHKRNTKLTHLSHLFREEEGIIIPPVNREEVDVQGVDGHIYKGYAGMSRPPKLEARLPTTLGTNNNNVEQRSLSPQPPQSRPPQKSNLPGKSPLITQRARPTSARTPPSPRPSSAGPGQGSRPQSAKPVIKSQEVLINGEDHTQVPIEAFVDQGPGDLTDEDMQQTQTIQMPSAEETGH